jgi:hypothetical protein
MLTLAVVIAILLQNDIIKLPWMVQIIIWGIAAILAVEEHRRSKFLFLLDTSGFIAASIFSHALLPLGMVVPFIAALEEIQFSQRLRTDRKLLITVLVFLVLWDILVVLFVYPHIYHLIRRFVVPAYIGEGVGGRWATVLGSGDYLVAGLLTVLFNMRWWEASIAFTISILAAFYIPDLIDKNYQWLTITPALAFIIPIFTVTHFLLKRVSRPLPLISGRGVWGLYYLISRRQNKRGR